MPMYSWVRSLKKSVRPILSRDSSFGSELGLRCSPASSSASIRSGPSSPMSIPGEGRASCLGDAAPVRVPTEQGCLHQRRVGDPTGDHSASSAVGGPPYLDPSDPGRPFTVGDDLQRELEQDRIEQPSGQLGPDLPDGLEQRRCRWYSSGRPR